MTTSEWITCVGQVLQVGAFLWLSSMYVRLSLRHRKLIELAERQQKTNESFRAVLQHRDELICSFAEMLMKSGKSPEDMYRWLRGEELH